MLRAAGADRLRTPPEEWVEKGFETTDDPAEATKYATLGSTLQQSMLPDEKQLNTTHSVSVSRSLRRLEDRDLVERKTLSYEEVDGEQQYVEVCGDNTRTTHITLTDAGETAADALQ